MKNTFVSAAHFLRSPKSSSFVSFCIYMYRREETPRNRVNVYKTKYSFCTTFAHLRRPLHPLHLSTTALCIIMLTYPICQLLPFLLLLLMRTRWESRILFVFLLLFAALKRCLLPKALERNRKKLPIIPHYWQESDKLFFSSVFFLCLVWANQAPSCSSDGIFHNFFERRFCLVFLFLVFIMFI